MTAQTARLLEHWRGRNHKFQGLRPFFCQVEAAETTIWLMEVAPKLGRQVRSFLDHLQAANDQANPGLNRLALKLATGAGKTTVMAMLIAWQAVNAARRPNSPRFSRGFLVVTPGITIQEASRLWLRGLHAVQSKLGISRVIDLSATPFFLRGSGYAEGTLFPWTMSDFSLMDAIECGIVKLPRVPSGEMPKFRELWAHIGWRSRCRARSLLAIKPVSRSILIMRIQTTKFLSRHEFVYLRGMALMMGRRSVSRSWASF